MSLIQFIVSKNFIKQLIIAIVAMVVFVFVLMKWLNISTNHDQKIEVPNLERMDLDLVASTLSDLDLKFLVLDSVNFNPNFPKNSVIEQDPEAGDFVKENRKIYLTLNPSSYKNVEIPDLYGKTKRQAISQLRAIGFRVSEKEEYVSDLAKDVVRGLKYGSKDLKEGDKIPKNSIIILKLGDGEGKTRYKKS